MVMGYGSYTKERNEEFARRYRSGETFESILKSCSLERHALRMALKSAGCIVSTKKEYKVKESLSEWHRRFGLMISDLLVKREIEKRQVALKLGMSLQQLISVCRGEHDLTIRQLFRFCEYFSLPIAEIFKKFLDEEK